MPTDTTSKLNLPLIAAAQAQKHITHNEALQALDTIVQLSVLDRDLATPPATPAEGDSYIVAAAATGDWAGHDGEIASFRNGGWLFHAPRPGWLAHVADENIFMFFDGAQWLELTSIITALQNLLRLGVNTTADDTNRLAVKSDAVLFSHDDASGSGSGDMRLKFNKAASANTASLVFQSNWSGRAEIGLAGDDDLAVKVSPDGSTWHTGLVIQAASGRLHAPHGLYTATDSLRIGYEAGAYNTGARQIALGDYAGFGNSGEWQLAVGPDAGRNNSGGYQTAIGSTAGKDNAGIGQTAVGPNAGRGNTGPNQVAIGSNAGRYNSGNKFTAIGYFAGADNTFDNATAIGALAVCTKDNQVRLGDSSVVEVYSSGAFVSDSFLRPASYTVATVPSASSAGAGAIIYVSDESGGAVLAFSDGTSWRRVTDGAIVS